MFDMPIHPIDSYFIHRTKKLFPFAVMETTRRMNNKAQVS